MSYGLSLLDKSPVAEGETGATALQRTVALAQNAERLGYRRFWVAEHHGFAGLASSAPEVLIAYLAARTRTIRIGSGGVLLPHYSPYKVAEIFNVLASLAPDRIDLGIGRAPGGFPASTKALRALHAPGPAPSFDSALAELDGFLGVDAVTGPETEARALPQPAILPERFLLGGSPDSARLAARRGWNFVYAGQHNGDEKAIEASFAAYIKAGGKGLLLLALTALVASTTEEARGLTEMLKSVRVTLEDGHSVNLSSEEQAAEYARQAGSASYATEIRKPQVLAGTTRQVRRELDQLQARFGISEFIIDTPPVAAAKRLDSVLQLAGEAPALAA